MSGDNYMEFEYLVMLYHMPENASADMNTISTHKTPGEAYKKMIEETTKQGFGDDYFYEVVVRKQQ